MSKILLLSTLCVLMTLLFSCDESLPPYQDPRSPFAGVIRSKYGGSDNNTFEMYITLKNIYDETLQDTAWLQGTLEITWLREPQYHKTVILDRTNLQMPFPPIDQQTQMFAMDPGDSLTLYYKWYLVDDSNTDISALFTYHTVPRCPGVLMAYPESFKVEGNFQVFKRIGKTTFPPITFVLYYTLGQC